MKQFKSTKVKISLLFLLILFSCAGYAQTNSSKTADSTVFVFNPYNLHSFNLPESKVVPPLNYSYQQPANGSRFVLYVTPYNATVLYDVRRMQYHPIDVYNDFGSVLIGGAFNCLSYLLEK